MKIKSELQEKNLKVILFLYFFKNNDLFFDIQAHDKSSGLQKELFVFRQQSLDLYHKLERKDKDLEEQKLKIQDLEKEKIFLEGQVKALLKKNKYLEVRLVNINRNTNFQSLNNTHTNLDDSIQ